MFEYITTKILHTPLGKRVDELLAKVQALNEPDQDDPRQRSSALSNMLNEMAIHSRRIQNRISLEAPRPRIAIRNSNSVSTPMPSQEVIIHSLYATSTSSPDYSVIAHDHRFPQNAVRPQRRSSRRRHHPPPAYSETDPNASVSAILSEMGLCVRSDVVPQLPPPYSLFPGSPAPRDG